MSTPATEQLKFDKAVQSAVDKEIAKRLVNTNKKIKELEAALVAAKSATTAPATTVAPAAVDAQELKDLSDENDQLKQGIKDRDAQIAKLNSDIASIMTTPAVTATAPAGSALALQTLRTCMGTVADGLGITDPSDRKPSTFAAAVKAKLDGLEVLANSLIADKDQTIRDLQVEATTATQKIAQLEKELKDVKSVDPDASF